MSVTPKWVLAILGAVALSTTAATLPVGAAPASSSRIERSLAGIRLGTRATTLVKQIGQPTRIELGAGAGTTGGAMDGGMGAGFDGGFGAGFDGGFPTSGAPMPGGMPMPGGPPMAGGPALGPPMPGASPFPGGPGASPFGLPQPGANPFSPAGPGEMGDTSGQLAVTYVYENFRKKPGFTLHIQIDQDGRVVQIVGTSLRPVSGVGTARGIGFGTRYSTVLGRYGWPQAHTAAGNFIQASYAENAHVAFQFLDGKVVRIVVAEVE